MEKYCPICFDDFIFPTILNDGATFCFNCAYRININAKLRNTIVENYFQFDSPSVEPFALENLIRASNRIEYLNQYESVLLNNFQILYSGRKLMISDDEFKLLVDKCDNLECVHDGLPFFSFVCSFLNFDLVKYVAEKGVKMDVIDDAFNMYPMHYICLRNDTTIDIINYFVNRGVDYECQSELKMRPIHYICRNENDLLELVKYFVEVLDADLECENEYGLRPIHYICRRKDSFETLKYLAEKNINLECVNKHKMSPIHYVCKYGTYEAFKYLVEEKNVNIYGIDDDGNQIIHYVCNYGLYYSCDEMKIIDDYMGRHIYRFISADDAINVIKYLVENKNVDINCINNKGNRPIHYVCGQFASFDIFKYFVDRVDVECANVYNERPIHFVCRYGTFEMLSYLFETKAVNLHIADNEGMRPIHNVCIYGSGGDSIKYLAENGVDINAIDNDGHSPLYYLMKHRNNDESREIIDYLIEKGAR